MVKTLDTYHKAGVYKVIFFDGFQALEAHRRKPNEIVPSLYVRYMNRSISVTDVERALKMGFMWIGEALLRHWGETSVAADDPVALQIYDLAAKYQVPITIHQDAAEYSGAYEELERALELCPNTTFVFHGWWLGRGSLQRVQDLERLIIRHPNLYVELAGQLEYSKPPWSEQTFLGGTGQDMFAYPDGRIREEWRNIFEKYPNRFINGFDLFTQSAYELENLKIRVDYWRNLLGQISQDAAERIAYKNVENLLAHNFSSISTSLATTTTQITEATEPTSTTIATTGVNQQVLDVLSQTNRLYIATAVLVSIALITVAYGLRKKWRSEFN
jgi:predicted TIM-barrel fold metal-dependent hydrolase